MHTFDFLCGYCVDGYTIHEYLTDYHPCDNLPVITYFVFFGNTVVFTAHDLSFVYDFIRRS